MTIFEKNLISISRHEKNSKNLYYLKRTIFLPTEPNFTSSIFPNFFIQPLLCKLRSSYRIIFSLSNLCFSFCVLSLLLCFLSSLSLISLSLSFSLNASNSRSVPEHSFYHYYFSPSRLSRPLLRKSQITHVLHKCNCTQHFFLFQRQSSNHIK